MNFLQSPLRNENALAILESLKEKKLPTGKQKAGKEGQGHGSLP